MKRFNVYAQFGRPVPSEHEIGDWVRYEDHIAVVNEFRDFLGKMQGVCMGVAMSGRDHPNPDVALMELFNEAQAILFPSATNVAKGGDHG